METNAEKECSALGGLFQMIINDLKGGTPAWEDFLGKATKLHSQLKATIVASAAFLDSFQKIADMATNTKGATKDIGTALTRLCLRHRSVEARLKAFTSSLMDSLVVPLQDKMEEWKKIAYQLDKDHAKEYKRVRQDIKKKSSDTLRLQKKVRKASKGDVQRSLDTALQDVTDRYLLLEETEKQAVRKALIEERSHYCLFVACLKPVVDSELALFHEVTHLQEIVDALTKLTEDPQSLPSASEQVISDIKGSDSGWSFHTPPSSPTSLGSRKSSMCSISSLNSSSSGSTKSHSPSHHSRCRSLSQQPPAGALRLSSVSSQDSGFTSQDTLCIRLPTPPPMELTNQVPNLSEFNSNATGVVSTTGTPASPYPPAPCVTATWPNLQDTLQFERAAASILKSQRPHTISSAYERAGHNRPALTAQTFQPLNQELQQGPSGMVETSDNLTSTSEDSSFEHSPEDDQEHDDADNMIAPNRDLPPIPTNPPLPDRNMEPDKPNLPEKPQFIKSRYSKGISHLESFVADISKAIVMSDDPPVYANLNELIPTSSVADSFPPPPVLSSEDVYDKSAFQKDLAAILAQSLLLQQQLQQNDNPSDDSMDLPPPPPPITEGSVPTSSPNNSGTLTRPGSHKPPPPIRRSSSLSTSSPVQQEFMPIKRDSEIHASLRSSPGIPSENTFRPRSMGNKMCEELNKSPPSVTESHMPARVLKKDAGRSGNSSQSTVSCTSASVPSEPTAHAQLIQALNARLSVLQHPELIDHGPKGKDQFFNPSTFSQNVQEINYKPPVHPMYGMAHTLAHPPKKSSRAHSLTGNDREAFIQSLNARFAQSQQAGFRTVQRKPSLQEPSLRVKHGTGHKSLPQQMAHRRASQPSLDQLHDVTMGFSSQEDFSQMISGERSNKQNFLAALNAKLAQQPGQTERRCSLQLDSEPGMGRSRSTSARKMMDNGHPSTSEAAARVQSWLASRGSLDNTTCRETLLCQIRQGISLRKVPSNDRSAPKF
ncbi:protein MTSS 2-like isoform X2 [Centruroides vittatus]|uniref:protein MTSS 2-like isoform X2 n=1 Tax=Centruroides vittatus TaxID=120091 RepID=UPI00350EAF7A